MRAAALLIGLALASCGSDPCDEWETEMVLHASGSCLPAPQDVTIQLEACMLRVKVAAGTLPATGALDQAGDPLRQGGWQIYGDACPLAAPACTAGREFRRCHAVRKDSHLDLSCVDGTGAPVCEAALTE
jgi:hypothetical protein